MKLLIELVRPDDVDDDSDGVAVISVEVARLELSDLEPSAWLARLCHVVGDMPKVTEMLEELTGPYKELSRRGDVSAGERAEVERIGLPLSLILLGLKGRQDLYLRIKFKECKRPRPVESQAS